MLLWADLVAKPILYGAHHSCTQDSDSTKRIHKKSDASDTSRRTRPTPQAQLATISWQRLLIQVALGGGSAALTIPSSVIVANA